MDDLRVPKVKGEVSTGLCHEIDECKKCTTDLDMFPDDVEEVEQLHVNEEKVDL